MKKLNEINVIISVKDIIQAFDKKFEINLVNNAIEYAKYHFYNINISIEKAKSILDGKVIKVKFYYAKQISAFLIHHLFEPSYIPTSIIEIQALIESILFNLFPLPSNVEIYNSIEEAKIKEMLNGTNALFEMPRKAINRLIFFKQERECDPVVLWCPMTFKQVKELLKRV